MNTRSKGLTVAAGALCALMAGSAFAQPHGGGGGGHSGGGGHFGGGGHVSGGAHFAAPSHGAPAGHFNGGAHFTAPGHVGAYRGAVGHGYSHYYPSAVHGAWGPGHGYYGRPGGSYYGHGYSTGAYWRGGWWHGGFWPRAYYGLGFAWFLPVLPLAYSTYWWSGVPYYYANDVYYTYSPDYEGYVATDPPPASDGQGAAEAPSSDAAPAPAGASIPGEVFMYPKSGQTPEQQAKDKAECQQWANSQAGTPAQNGNEYRRAMAACAEGRGYSVQ